MPRVFTLLLTSKAIACYAVLMINPNAILFISFTIVVGALLGSVLIGLAVDSPLVHFEVSTMSGRIPVA